MYIHAIIISKERVHNLKQIGECHMGGIGLRKKREKHSIRIKISKNILEKNNTYFHSQI